MGKVDKNNSKNSPFLRRILLSMVLGTAAVTAFPGTTPNIVIILADDLGYGDLSCYGSKEIQTPNLDKLASQGVRFTSFYANAPECTPTRTALLTGRYQQRVGGLECAIGVGNIGRYEEALALSDKGELGLPAEFNTIPSILKLKGYNTAVIGKWHLGYGEDFSPEAHGFDYSIGPYGGAVDYFLHTEPAGTFQGVEMEGKHDFYRNGKPQDRDGYYMTHLITDESVEWINIQKKDKPFFLYVPYTAPHEPIQGPDDYSPDVTWKNGDKETYIKVVEELDIGVGKILQKLEEKGFAENTLVIFFSDNGPTKKGNAGPFSGFKGQVFEGGIHVPCIIKWPGKIEPGITSDQMAISMDLTASVASIVDGYPEKPLDGIDIVGHITSGEKDYPRTLFWRKLRRDNVLKAIRDDNLKYIRNARGGEISEYLFDLAVDTAEKNNLLDIRKEDAERLKKLLEEWEEDVQPERYKTLINETFDYPDGPLPEKFWSEGCQAEIKDGHLYVNANDVLNWTSTVWLDQKLSGNLSVEYDAHIVSSAESKNNINCFFLYSYPGDKTLWDTRDERKDAKYQRYHPLSGYIFTFVTDKIEKKERFRLRDDPGFNLLDEYFGDEAIKEGKTYHIRITKIGEQLTYYVDGKKILDNKDDQFNPVHEKGLFGFRTAHSEIWWDNLVITQLD